MNVLEVEHTRGQVYNLASEEVMRLSEFLQLVARMVEKPIRIYQVPEKVLLDFGIPLDISPFSGPWVSYMDPSLAREEIRFRSIPVAEWLRETVHWFIDEYRGPNPENYRFRSRELELAQYWRKKMKLD